MKSTYRTLLAVLLTALTGLAQEATKPCQGQAAAYVLHVQGSCYARQGPGASLKMVTDGQELPAGQALQCDMGARLTIRFCGSGQDKIIENKWYLVPTVPQHGPSTGFGEPGRVSQAGPGTSIQVTAGDSDVLFGSYVGTVLGATGETPVSLKVRTLDGKITGSVTSDKVNARITDLAYSPDGQIRIKFNGADGKKGLVDGQYKDGKITGNWLLGDSSSSVSLEKADIGQFESSTPSHSGPNSSDKSLSVGPNSTDLSEISVRTVGHVLLLCAVINYGLLIVWFILFVLPHGWLYRLWARWFHLSIEQFDAINFGAMALYKIGIILLNLIPYIALRILG